MILLIECVVAIILFTAIVIPIALKNSMFIIGDYPPAIIKKCIELKIIPERKTRFTKREIVKKIIACILFVLLFAFMIYKFNGADTFIKGFINSYIIWFVIAWYDALVIDCIFFCHSKNLEYQEQRI